VIYISRAATATAKAIAPPAAPPPTSTARGTLRASNQESHPVAAPMITANSNTIAAHAATNEILNCFLPHDRVPP